MKKFFAWMKSTGGIASYVALPIMATVVIIFYVSVIFHLNNIVSKSTHQSGLVWHIVGWVLTGVCIIEAYSWSKKDTDKGDYIFFLVTLIASWCSFYGFSF